MAEYKLSFTAEEIETSLNDINNLLHYPTITWAEVDDCVLPGYYYIADTKNIDGFTANYWYLNVSAYTTGLQHCTQILEPIKGTDSYRLKRIKRSGEWEPWEWENPPLKVPDSPDNYGMHYRTTERYNGKAVYAHTFYGSINADSPSATWTLDTPENKSITVIRVAARTQDHNLPYKLRDEKKFKELRVRTDGTSLTYERSEDACSTADTIFAQIYYVIN